MASNDGRRLLKISDVHDPEQKEQILRHFGKHATYYGIKRCNSIQFNILLTLCIHTYLHTYIHTYIHKIKNNK